MSHTFRFRHLILFCSLLLFYVPKAEGQHLTDINRHHSAKQDEQKLLSIESELKPLENFSSDLSKIELQPRDPDSLKAIAGRASQNINRLKGFTGDKSSEMLRSFQSGNPNPADMASLRETKKAVDDDIARLKADSSAIKQPPSGDTSSFTLQGLGSFMTGFGVETVPTIAASGSYTDDSMLHLYSELKILKGVSPADTLNSNTTNRIFVPEASYLSIQFNNCWAIVPERIGINLDLSAGSKNVYQDTTRTGHEKINSFVMGQAALLAEVGIAPRQLSLYAGVSYSSPIVNRAAYQSYFVNQSNDLWNLVFGIHGTLDRRFQIDLRLIVLNNRTTNLFFGTNVDPVLMVLNFTVPQDLLSGS